MARGMLPARVTMKKIVFWGGLLALSGCVAETTDPGVVDPADDSPPLSDVDALLMGAPDNDTLPEEGKADDVYPAQFDLASTQSPIRSQGGRGVCSIFATVALMEHLYISEGTMLDPDFSEQFLQWSTKVEQGVFTYTEGSSQDDNIDTIAEHGLVRETDWRYESSPWGPTNDPMCMGRSQPVRCYTNGNPPESALAAQRFHLPASRYINSSARSIKGHMIATNQAVIVGGTFYYQAWNHRLTTLGRSLDYWAQGWVLAPNAEDRRVSTMGDNRAGHAFVLVGWDDTLSVQKRDAMGNPAVDAMGQPVMETGFFLFKNSWGTGAFGTRNRFGAGYGWISYAYVAELSANVSGLPEMARPEICNDTIDNDGNGASDCDDAMCRTNPACMMPMPMSEYTNRTPVPIPDNDTAGAQSLIKVMEVGTVSSLAVRVEIDHTYRGDLKVVLIHEGRQATLHDREGGGEDDLRHMYSVDAFNGEPLAGDWTLVVSDNARVDTGTIESWTMTPTL